MTLKMAAVSELRLIVPGICGPLAEVHSLNNNVALKHWVKLLSRAHSAASADNLQDIIKSIFKLQTSGDLPSAALTMLANESYDASLNYMHADPVHLRADMDHAVLTSSADLAINKNESDEICAALNQHFNQDGLTFYIVDKDRWVLSSKNAIQIETTPLADAVGRNVNFLLPQGAGSAEWKQMLTEAQMLMHSHDVNVGRENDGHQSINSLWFHGSGKLPEITGCKVGSVCSNSDVFKGLALQAKSDYSALPDSADEYIHFLLSDRDKNVNVLHISELEQLTNYTDVSIWLDRLTDILEDWLYPLINMANKNNIKVMLYPCNNKQYQFSKYDSLRFWRKGSLDQHVDTY